MKKNQKTTKIETQEGKIEQFYAYHNARLYDEKGECIASLMEPMFISKDITNKNKEEIEQLAVAIKKEFCFDHFVIKEENGNLYAVFQMFANIEDAKNFLCNYLQGEFEEVMGIYEKITEDYIAEVETEHGNKRIKGRYVDNYYLKSAIIPLQNITNMLHFDEK